MKNFSKKALSLLLAVMMLASLCTTALAAGSYTDVPADKYYSEFLETLTASGVIKEANGLFNPNKACTRSVFVTWLWRAAGSPAPKAASTLSDVEAGKEYTDAVAWAQEVGVTTGKNDGSFGVNDTVTRAQMVTFMYRFATALGMAGTDRKTDITGYPDYAIVPSHAKETIGWAIEVGMMQGTTDGKLNPNGLATRAHAVAFMGRLLDTGSGNSSTAPTISEIPTRAEMEAALGELAFQYFLKGEKIQYDSTQLTNIENVPLGKFWDGIWRTNYYSTPEDATEDNTIFTVCSDYMFNIYLETLGYPISGHRLNAITAALWNFTESQNMVVARWWGPQYNGTGQLNSTEQGYGVTDTYYMNTADFRAFLANWKENLRPGDILDYGTHSQMYVGAGLVLDSGGSGYNLESGVDAFEKGGSVNYLHSLEALFLDGTDAEYKALYQVNDDKNAAERMVIVRPLNALCIDDGDGNPANDKLNTAYYLPTHPALRYPEELVRTGYNITDATKVRMEFPGMDVDRTVDISRQGTALKGGELTYSVKIINKSNNADYCRWQTAMTGKTYKGTDYQGVVVTEKVPAGTELVSTNGKVSGDTITWTVDVKAGQTANCTYTVKVTGNIGDEIVSEGGTVKGTAGVINSNSFTNLIGGEKIGAAAQEKLTNLYNGGVANFASNGLPSTSVGTTFASRIYKRVMGIELTLPTAQEIVDNLFEIVRIYEPEGYHTYRHLSREAWMYRLKDTVSAEYQTVRDMVIYGYLGGRFVYTDVVADEARVDEFNTEYLEPGDVLIYAKLSDYPYSDAARTVTDSKVVVYVGDGKFVAVNSSGIAAATDSPSTMTEAWTYDFMVGLRPSQAYADINANVYDPAKDTDDPSKDAPIVTYQRADSLSAANKSLLASLTGADSASIGKVNTAFAGSVYAILGINIDQDLKMPDGSTATFGSILRYVIFEEVPEGSYKYELREKAPVGNEKLFAMLVDGWYGGRGMIVPGAADKTLASMRIGDILSIGDRSSGVYWIMVYQGNGNFLVSKRGTPEDPSARIYTQENYTEAALAELLKNQSYEAYYLLRPSQAYDNVNHPEWVDPTGGAGSSGSGSSSDGDSTGTEPTPGVNENNDDDIVLPEPEPDIPAVPLASHYQTELQYLTDAAVEMKLGVSQVGLNFTGLEQMYRAAGIDVKGMFLKLPDDSSPSTISTACTAIFTANGINQVSEAFVGTRSALVPGFYDGKKLAVTVRRSKTMADLQIGDAIAATVTVTDKNNVNGNVHWVGIYQGNGQFIMSRQGLLEDTAYRGRGEVVTFASEAEFDAVFNDLNWRYYFVLRPTQYDPTLAG